MQEEIQVVACVIEREGKFLITRRLKESHLGHLWEFPGGKIEPGESLAECAVRECEEEVGVVVRPLELVQELKHSYPEVQVHLFFMRCELISGTPRPIECADLTWAAPEELKNYEFPEADRALIQQLRATEPQLS